MTQGTSQSTQGIDPIPNFPHPNLISICGMCRNKPDPQRPHSQANSTHRVHCHCPNAGHHRTPVVHLLLCLNVFQPFWWHENVHNICFLLSGPSIMKCLWSTLFCIMTWNIAIFIGYIIQPWLTGPPTSWKSVLLQYSSIQHIPVYDTTYRHANHSTAQ